MPVVIGVDEAGYGPNLGPLVVAATVWEVAEGVDCAGFYKLLRRVVASTLDKASARRVVWADSKVVYKPGNGLDHLERGVLAALATFECMPRGWSELWGAIDWRAKALVGAEEICAPAACEEVFSESGKSTLAGDLPSWQDLPWHAGYSATLPVSCDCDEMEKVAGILADGLAAAGIRLVDVLARPVFPAEFNSLVDELGNKSDTLSCVTLELVAEALRVAPEGPATVYCDKHGARNRYHAHLQTRFADAWIEVRMESDEQSSYRFQSDGLPIEIGFWVCGERFLPVALASMTAKYLREMAMRPFNEFWCSRLPELKPTAGYPGDSRRFKGQIEALQAELGIEDRVFWRVR